MKFRRKKLAENIPLKKQHLDDILDETGFDSKNLSIRETNRLATIINNEHNIEFVRMEMGIPNIPTSNIAKEAEKEDKWKYTILFKKKKN